MRANFHAGDIHTKILGMCLYLNIFAPKLLVLLLAISGDSGYASLPWMLVPFLRPQNDQERRYNTAIKRVRSSVERCIGVLKARFRCLLKDRTLHYSPRNASRIVMACSILHNIARNYNVDEPVPELDEIDGDLAAPPIQEDGAYREAGQNARRAYVMQYF